MPLNVASVDLAMTKRSSDSQMSLRPPENASLTGVVIYFPKSSSKENFWFSLWDERVKYLLLSYLSTVPTLQYFSWIFFSCAQCHLYYSRPASSFLLRYPWQPKTIVKSVLWLRSSSNLRFGRHCSEAFCSFWLYCQYCQLHCTHGSALSVP